MTSRTWIVALSLVAASCSDSITAPSPVVTPEPPAATPVVSSPSPSAAVGPQLAPSFVIAGRDLTCGPPSGRYHWDVTVVEVTSRTHLVTFASHNREPGCAATIVNGRSWFESSGQDLLPHQTGKFALDYDPRHVDCGRVQLDASLVDDAGGNVLLLGTVIDYGKVCPDPPPPPTPAPVPPAPPVPPPVQPVPPPTPTPFSICPDGDAAILLTHPRGSERNVTGNGTNAMATFSIAPGCKAIPVSLVSYQKLTADFLPQRFIDGAFGKFDAGGPYTLTVRIAPCSMQADLYSGGFIQGEALDWSNWERDYNPRTLDWIYSAGCQ